MGRFFKVIALLQMAILSYSTAALAVEIAQNTISGTYARKSQNEEAELTVKQLPNGMASVNGMSLWGTNQQYGPNMGELSFTARIQGSRIQYSERNGSCKHKVMLVFSGNELTVKEECYLGVYGMNVSFAGTYRKVTLNKSTP